MREPLLLLPLVGLLPLRKSPMEIVNESLLKDSFKETGGENVMLFSLSSMDA